ncbi:MAG: Asp-tRNA(Asn)/Glu-tRNA(Gln) amidotransferase subunit GatB, partial [Verrucomicrobiota bacterium]
PHEKQKRFMEEFGVTAYDGGVLAADPDLAAYFEETAKGTTFGKKVANWVINNLLSALREDETTLKDCPLRPESLRSLLQLVEEGQVTNNQAKEMFPRLYQEPGQEPAVLAKEMGFEPADLGEIEGFVEEVIAGNPGPVEQIKGGNPKAINALLGQVMKKSGGKADPKVVRQLLEEKI